MNIFDADAHVIEPPELWVERLDRALRDRAPRVEMDVRSQKGVFFLCEDSPPLRIGSMYAAGQDLRSQMEAGMEACPPGAYDPTVRLKDMDADGVAAQVLYTSLGFSLFGIKDPVLQRACFQIYNHWLAEFCRTDPDRLVGLGLISLLRRREWY